MNKKYLALSILLASLSTTVFAQSQYPEFDDLDDDGDRNLTEEEVRMNSILKRLEFDFDVADTNGDGFVNRREYTAYTEKEQ